MAIPSRRRQRQPAHEKSTGTLGQMGRSQAVSTYGIGSIYELRSYRVGSSLHSVMIAGLDWWPSGSLQRLREPSLEKALDVSYFLLPPPGTDPNGEAAIPAVRFPRWLVCNNSKCSRLGHVPAEFEDLGGRGPRCRAQGCGGKGIPVRLIIACFHSKADTIPDNQPGHIDDFPWEWWAHSGQDGVKRCASPQLKLESTGTTAALAGLVVRCHSQECAGRVSRSLEGVFGENALRGFSCSGSRPWLHDQDAGCQRKVRVLQRGASNVYFPVTASAISIPPNSSSLIQVLATNCDALIQNVGKFPIASLIEMAKNSVPGLGDRFSDRQIEEALLLLGGIQPDALPVTEAEQREKERTAIIEGRSNDDDKGSEFVAEVIPDSTIPPSVSVFFQSLVKLHRLREVRALRGFQRVSATSGPDSYQISCAPIFKKPKKWLPAIEVRGEGIYLELSADRLSDWANTEGVKQRLKLLVDNYRRKMLSDGLPVQVATIPTAQKVLVHTLSHILMKQLSLECGYSSASLRERLYLPQESTAANYASVLIYTATTGADGTLGGLVRQGEPERLRRILMGAIEGARWCSSDPLCIESEGQGADALNLAACHACALVSETSCELRNTFLDRALLVGLPDDPLGFFSGLEI